MRMTSPSTLIFGEAKDLHIVTVLSKLTDNTVPLIIDFSRFGKDYIASYVTDGSQQICTIRDKHGNRFILDSVDKVWWRRPQPFSSNEKLAKHIRPYVAEEHRCFWGGVLSTFSEAIWFNDLDKNRMIDRKINQLKIASLVGFKIPDTCVTSDEHSAKRFLEKHDNKVIFKSFSGSEDFWQPTRPYLETYFRHLKSLSCCPVIFQEYIDADCEYRVTVIEGQIFVAMKNTSKSRYKYDTRIDCALRHEASSLSLHVEKQLHQFMQFSGIRYGAFDLILSKTGELFFIEVNPAGQFLYIEAETGLQISSAMGAALSSGKGTVSINEDDEEIKTAYMNDIFSNIVKDKVTHIKDYN